MKKLFIAAACIAALVSCNAPQSATEQPVVTREIGSSDIAFVSMERVLTESDIFLSEGLALQKRSETANRDWRAQEQKLQDEATQLQQRYQNGLITSTNAQLEQQKLEQKLEQFRTTTEREMRELDEENTVFANRAQKLIRSAVDVVNRDKRYKMIVNASALIDADSTLDISSVVLVELNKLYKEEKK
ncbi:MAG: OmpH family outer membrane protein [Rikenellaceae bacterium]